MRRWLTLRFILAVPVAFAFTVAGAACSDSDTSPVMGAADGSTSPGTADAPPTGSEDFDLEVDNFKTVTNFTTVPQGFKVANPLGHESEAVAAAKAGTTIPVGTVVKNIESEIMVKRRAGFNPSRADWDYIKVTFNSDGVTPMTVTRDAHACFDCHKQFAQRDYICAPPP